MLYVLTAFFACVLATVSLPVLSRLALRYGLVDRPSARKHHRGQIPLVGGISIFVSSAAAILISLLAVAEGSVGFFVSTYLIPCLLILVLGVVDDYRDVSVKLRIFVQAAIASLLFWGSDFSISSLGAVFYFDFTIPIWAAYPLTLAAVIGAINAFNMIDGLDGLLGGITVTSFAALAYLFTQVDSPEVTLVCLTLMAVLGVFLCFNLEIGPAKPKVFSGDAGSMVIGFSMIWLLIAGSQSEFYKDESAFRPVMALWIVGIPLLDMVRVMIARSASKISPFAAGRDHVHHILLDSGLSSGQSSMLTILLHVVLVISGITLAQIGTPEWAQLSAYLLIGGLYFVACQYVRASVSANPKEKLNSRSVEPEMVIDDKMRSKTPKSYQMGDDIEEKAASEVLEESLMNV